MVYEMQLSAQNRGFRTWEAAIMNRKNSDDRSRLARCNSLQEQLQATQPGAR
jgi:hypothetical protein